MLPQDKLTELLIQQAIDALNAVSSTLERLKAEMRTLAAQLLNKDKPYIRPYDWHSGGSLFVVPPFGSPPFLQFPY